MPRRFDLFEYGTVTLRQLPMARAGQDKPFVIGVRQWDVIFAGRGISYDIDGMAALVSIVDKDLLTPVTVFEPVQCREILIAQIKDDSPDLGSFLDEDVRRAAVA